MIGTRPELIVFDDIQSEKEIKMKCEVIHRDPYVIRSESGAQFQLDLTNFLATHPNHKIISISTSLTATSAFWYIAILTRELIQECE